MNASKPENKTDKDETEKIKLLVWRHAMGLIKAIFSVDEIIARLMKQEESKKNP